MAATNTDAPAGPTTVEGLRAVADWLEQHPDEQVMFSIVRIKASTREDLERVAARFGDEAEEKLSYEEVQITRRFGARVEIYAGVHVNRLRDEPPVAKYDPILAGRS